MALALWGCTALAGPDENGPAPGGGVPSTESSHALDAGHTGLELYEAQNWDAALKQFRIADRLAHSPVFTLYKARCQRNLGHLLAALKLYDRLLAEPVSRNAHISWGKARADGAAEQQRLVTRIPEIAIRVTGIDPARARVMLDGRRLSPDELAGAFQVDPGSHEIVAMGGGRTQRIRVDAAEGGRVLSVAISLAPAPGPRVARRRGTSRDKARAVPEDSNWGMPAAIALGIGGLGVVAGSVLGLLARDRTEDIKQNCDDNHCLASDAEKGAGATRLANASTIAFAIGGLGLGTGLVFIILPEDSATARPSGALAHFRGNF